MPKVTILHNPRCRKSRETLDLLIEHNIDPEIVEYLKTPLSKKELTHIANLLDVPPIEMIRTKEKLFKELGLSKNDEDPTLFSAMAENPILVERPIVIVDNKKAAIGRPPEKVLEIL